MMNYRKIIHVDMDAFYASVEQLDNPELRGLPIAVGGNEVRGVISAASYEARKFGVRSALTGSIAIKRCPNLIFVKPRFERYKEISKMVHSIFYEYTNLVEPLSLDEAFLDVTENKKGMKSASLIAEEIRLKIFEKTGLTASAGISTNKFIAKIASDYNKPNGQKTINPEEIESFIESLEIKKFFGIGQKTADRMYHLGIFTGLDLKQKNIEFLEEHFGNSAQHYYNISRGIHNSPVQPNRIPKSIAAERTFETNLTSEIFLKDKLNFIAEELDFRLKKRGVSGKTVTLKIKYSDFTVQTRSETLPYFISNKELILDASLKLLYQDKLRNSVRLIGVSMTNLNNKETKPKLIQLRFNF